MPLPINRNFLLCGNSLLSKLQVLNMSKASAIKTFVFLDLETTGLPSEENNKTRITELSMTAIQAEHLSLGVVPTPPRVQNKLTLCFNPCKMIGLQCEEVTGLSNDKLEHMSRFTDETVNLINSYLKHLPQAVCLVAHNGNCFDFPILLAEINKAKGALIDVLCMDSLEAFREIEINGDETDDAPSTVDKGLSLAVPLEHTTQYDEILCDLAEDELSVKDRKRSLEVQNTNETTPKKSKLIRSNKRGGDAQGKSLKFRRGFKLTEVYERYTKNPAIKAHQAEADVFMLMMSAASAGDKFIRWADENAKKFCDVKPMMPGKKIGT